MINQIKKMRNMATSQAVLNRLEFIQKIKESESLKDFIGLSSDYKSYEKLETIAYKIAVRKANTVEEIEKCAVSVEENYSGIHDPDELAEQIRIKAYGMEWYLSKILNSQAFKEFESFATTLPIQGLYHV